MVHHKGRLTRGSTFTINAIAAATNPGTMQLIVLAIPLSGKPPGTPLLVPAIGQGLTGTVTVSPTSDLQGLMVLVRGGDASSLTVTDGTHVATGTASKGAAWAFDVN